MIGPRDYVAFAITTAWVVSILAEIWVEGYGTPLAIHGLMGLVAGYFYKRYRE